MNRFIPSQSRRPLAWAGSLVALGVLLLAAGCASKNPNPDQPFVFPGTAPAAPAAPAVQPSPENGIADFLATTTATTSVLRPGETITIAFSDLAGPHKLDPMDVRIGEDGKVTLLFSVTFVAAGKTASQLQEEIRAAYVPKYYKELTVTVKGSILVYFVGGEVRNPNMYTLHGRLTVLRAIDTAGGYNEYAKKTAIKLMRSTGEEFIIDGKKAVRKPELDLQVLPNDRIFVPRRGW